LTYTRFLKIKLRRNNIISAPTAPVKIAPTQPEPKLTPCFPKDQLPIKLPIIPTMIFPISPRLLPLNIELPSHPAIAPITKVLIIYIIFRFSYYLDLVIINFLIIPT